jgi:metal-responsive CopG/Arc/MetJ family transcriptional regulator
MADKKIYIAITLTGELARMFDQLKQARELGNNSEFTRSLLTFALKAQLKKAKAK